MKTKDFILCVIVLCIWGSSSTLVSKFTYNANPVVVSGMVTIVSTLILSLQLFNKENRILLKKVGIRELSKLVIPAVLGLYLYPIAYFSGISGSSPIRANILNYLWPLIAFITSKAISQNKLKLSETVSIILATLGGYIVLFFNNSVSFNADISRFDFIAFLGAVFYGMYTAIIEYFIPNASNGNQKLNGDSSVSNRLPALLRMYIMVLISFLLYIPLFLWFLICKPAELYSTLFAVIGNNTNLISILFYSIVNYSIAHFLWNKLNTDNNITITASMAFIIPLVSTIVLAVSSKSSIGLAPSIGLILIVMSIIINNRKQINSINATFVSIIILTLLLMITPHINNEKVIEDSKFFLEIIIALFSIYYGFVMNRVVDDIKKLEYLVDTLHAYKKKVSLRQKTSLEKLGKNIYELKKANKDIELYTLGDKLVDLIPKDIPSDDRQIIIERYYDLYRCSNRALSLSEWLIIIILSTLIICLCFIVCDGTLLSSVIVISVGSAICLCVSSLYEYEIRKNRLLNKSCNVVS